MKKLFVIVAVVAAIVLLLPLVGNKIAQEEIAKKIEVLTSYGVKVEKSEVDAGYFKTKNHYEFSVADTQKFLAYLNQFANSQIPPYVGAALEGTVVGVDLEYCNFPLSDTLGVDIYPLQMPHEMMDEIRENDLQLAKHIETLLQNKGVLYHLDYGVASNEFGGYIKDIREKTKLKKGAEVEFVLEGITYDGKGPLIAPSALRTETDAIVLHAHDDKTKIAFEIRNMSSEAAFESDTTYTSSLRAEQIVFDLNDTDGYEEYFAFDFKGITMDFGSDAKEAKAKASADIAVKDFYLHNDFTELQAQGFRYAININEMDKDGYENLISSVEKMQNAGGVFDERELEEAIVTLLEKGIVIELEDFSLQTLTIEAQKFQGASLYAKASLKPNPQFGYNMKAAPMSVMDDLSAEATFKISKELFGYITKQAPISAMALGYTVEEGNEYVYRLKYENNNLTINGKSL